MSEHSIGPLSQIPPGEGRNFLVAEQMIAVFHTREGAVFATQAACPHLGGPLADGLVDARGVVCPLHDRMFSFATGAGLGNECTVTVFPARIAADGMVMLSV
jgi:nitrite reductase (NADH) small subunit